MNFAVVKTRAGAFCVNLVALALGVLLFAGAFPNPVFENGLAILAWIAYIPIFWVVRRCSFGASVFWGALYGYSAYGVFNYWLSVFHPLAGVICSVIYLTYFALLFPLLKLALVLFPQKGYLLQFLLWMGYEYLRTKGFVGYAYGITGYSQWQFLPLIQIASITGVWGVSALVVFPSAWLAAALPKKMERAIFRSHLLAFCKREKIAACGWVILLVAALIYGGVAQVDYAAAPRAKLALIQPNSDPWKGGVREFRKKYQILKRLSDEVIGATENLDLVVWPETAFVPSIHWHQTRQDNPQMWALVKELLDYMATQKVPFVIGNDDARSDPALNPNPAESHQVDYNATVLFEKGEITGLYRKLHLVPFTEHFPYEKQFPLVHEALVKADTHFWEKGQEAVVFESDGLKFSTPICFEDTFGEISREFTRNGAELIVNLTNDAWSKSLSAQMQHLTMAVFRAVENRRSLVRATSSGQTSAIDPNGKVLAMAEPFAEVALIAEVPVVKIASFYTAYGDWLAWFFIIAAVGALLVGVVLVSLDRTKKKRDG